MRFTTSTLVMSLCIAVALWCAANGETLSVLLWLVPATIWFCGAAAGAHHRGWLDGFDAAEKIMTERMEKEAEE